MSNRCYDCGHLKPDCICVFRLYFVDGATMAFDRRGVLVGVTDTDDNVEDPEGYSLGNGCPDIHGIWYDDEKCTIPWDEVVDYTNTDFHLTSGMYIDNGQVIEEGRITKIDLNGDVKWNINKPDDNKYVELFHRFRSELSTFEAYYEAVYHIVEDNEDDVSAIGENTKAVHDAYKALPEEER
jgi:hypothetical protein